MLLVMGGLGIVLWWLHPQSLFQLAERVHWTTIAVLTGLMLLSRALELSGYLTLWGRRLLVHLRGERRLAMGLVIGSMANLIALRLARQPGMWREFHHWSLPVLGLAWLFAVVLKSALTW